jgi:hypothetical protein
MGKDQKTTEQDKPVSPEDESPLQQLLEIARTTAESLGLTLKEQQKWMAKLDASKAVADDSVDTSKQQLSMFEDWIKWATIKQEAMSADWGKGLADGATE